MALDGGMAHDGGCDGGINGWLGDMNNRAEMRRE